MLIQEVENYAQQLATILQYFKQEADARNKGAVIPIEALSDFMDDKGMDINPDIIKNLMNDPTIKNLIKYLYFLVFQRSMAHKQYQNNKHMKYLNYFFLA